MFLAALTIRPTIRVAGVFPARIKDAGITPVGASVRILPAPAGDDLQEGHGNQFGHFTLGIVLVGIGRFKRWVPDVLRHVSDRHSNTPFQIYSF